MEAKEQLSINTKERQEDKPIDCLGKTFKDEDERRAYFTKQLRMKLPELKKIDGFPIGEDEDILALSDPPYYTACPNPFVSDFIKQWEKEREELYEKGEEDYHREPFAADVSEGKNDPIYNAHSYHTKVPYKAIQKYISHYTDRGDIVLDGFSGTGMTGIAVQDMKGDRKAIINDISASASYIGFNYNMNHDKNLFLIEANSIFDEIRKNCSWVYKTIHSQDENEKCEYGDITNTVWSDVFICNNCSHEIVFWDNAVDIEKKEIKHSIVCENCNSKVEKSNLKRAYQYCFDPVLSQSIKQAKSIPVYIFYEYNGRKYKKTPDEYDHCLLKKIEEECIASCSSRRIIEGDESRRNDKLGITHTHHFYTKRNLYVLTTAYNAIIKQNQYRQLLFFLHASIQRATKTNRFRFGGTGGLSGTLYIPSLIFERNIIELLKKKYKDFNKIINSYGQKNGNVIVATQSSTQFESINDNCIDYIFTDPPFGDNLMYSELNFLWEAWLKIYTNNEQEAIVNKVQKKGLHEYQQLMTQCFSEYYRVLKPGRWMTVEFSNSKASVWNAIQEAIQRAGFIIANVSALDKKQGSFKAVTTTTAVKQDLVISAYKPSVNMLTEIKHKQNTEDSAWSFVRKHLENLPVFIGEKGAAELIVERTPRVLFDRMVAYHVQKGINVPISSAEFQLGVTQLFPMRDGMAFLETQVVEYDKKRFIAKDFIHMSLFVSDENSAIEWLRQQLLKKPQTRQELHPGFMKEIQHIAKHELLPELDILLEQNFLKYDGKESVPSQIHGYLSTDYKDLRGLDKSDARLKEKAKDRWYIADPNKQADLEKMREKMLLREFDSYVEQIQNSRKKLKEFRTEAIRTGFKQAYNDKKYKLIIEIGNRLPEAILQEDDKLLMYYDNAQL